MENIELWHRNRDVNVSDATRRASKKKGPVAAQRANEWDMEGHAQKAKNLLTEVNRALKLAAEKANRNAR